MLRPSQAEETLARLEAAEPDSFKMVHQVVAKYGERQHAMTGYVLARRDGSFRVSAAASLGPRLFDVVRLRGKWDARVHLTQLAEKLDPRHIGRAVERIYLVGARGPLIAEEGYWLQRAEVAGEEDFDRVELLRDDSTMALAGKRFFRGQERSLEVHYDRLERVQSHWLARRVRLKDERGFEIALNVTEYVPGFPVPDEKLRLGA
ncbi:MAG TPA: hypothetical protein VEY30_10135 [Myxococcaceae bacterium]|nr:hypothetical protein [Myxococcaceae bacterium]